MRPGLRPAEQHTYAQLGTYTYGEDGARIRKNNVINSIFTGSMQPSFSLFGVMGESPLTPSLDAMPNAPGDAAGTHYYLADQLGTTQLEFAAGGFPVWRGEFAPFGQELDTQATTNHYKFTGKERDTESGLDCFGARYFGSTMGRFMSPDPMIIMKQKLIDPQQWNMYSYARNNPLRFTDPTGKYVCADGSKCDSKNDQAFKTRLDNLRTAQAGLKAGSDAYNKIGAILTAYGNAGDTGTANGKTLAISFTGAANGGGVTQSLDKSTIGVNLSSNFSEQSGANNLGTTVLVGHEGQHVVEGAPTGTARFGSEVRAESASQTIGDTIPITRLLGRAVERESSKIVYQPRPF